STIVVNYNGAPEIIEALESLERQTLPPHEIIVVDNGSTDGSADLVEEQFPDVRLVRAGENLGFAAGSNLGASLATGRYLALLNPDASAHPDWLRTLVTALESDDRFAVAVGKVYAGRSRTIEQAGAHFNNLGNYWGRGHLELDEGQYDEVTEVTGLTGCAMLIDRDALHDEPMFDSDIFMYGEELDLTIRLRRRGYGVVYTPYAVVHHEGMASVRRSEQRPRVFQQRLSNRNRSRLLAKYYPSGILLRSAPLLILGLGYWFFWFLRESGPRAALELLIEIPRYFLRGRRERKPASAEEDSLWLSLMTSHNLRGAVAQARRMKTTRAG
ncbi:MAG TPA: glycosyltransferase family 2 protein, partial [Thermoanaerobaculia bacterium]|nr:glycosyltransferase family 2 protein [Thermoanaerobaculia bacterium]